MCYSNSEWMTSVPGRDGRSMLSSPRSSVDDESDSPPIELTTTTTTTTTTTNKTLFDVVQTLYCLVKDAWAQGKGVPVVRGVFDATESVAANIIERILDSTMTTKTTTTTIAGNARGMILVDIDERILKPRMKLIDDALVSPSIAEVCRIFEAVLRTVDGMVIGLIASGPLIGIFADRNGTNVDVELV